MSQKFSLLVALTLLASCSDATPVAKFACSDAGVVALDEVCGSIVETAKGQAQIDALVACELLVRSQAESCGHAK